MNRSRALLILAVLAGVLAMHGLGMASPSGVSGHRMPASASVSGHRMPASASVSMSDVRVTCPDDDGMPEHRDGHADQLCVSGAVPDAPMLPVLAVTGPAGAPAEADRASDAMSDGPVERAPPSLSELQLLRI